MTAIFRIIQSAAPGEWGIARQDLTLVGVGGTITLEAETQVSPLETYIWEVISQPEGSVADTTLTVPNPATAPWIATVDLDVTGGYAIRLIYQPGTPAEDITILYLGVALDNSGLCVPAFNETIFDNSYAAGGSGDTYVGYERKLTAFLKWMDANVGAGGVVHALGGAAHLADTLANLNTKISDATLFGQELFDANTMLVATIDNTPAPLVIAVSSFVGRKSTGDISAMTPAEARTVLNVAAGADVTADNPPQAHHVSHENGGSDEISVAGLSGVLAEAQNPTAHALGGAAHSADTLANLNTKISDADLSDVASGITNDSAVSGTNVDDALDNLDTTITSIISGYSRRKKVINIVDGTLAPPTEVTGDRYIPDDTGALHADWDGASAWDIVEFDSANWVATTPIEGWVTYIDTLNQDALFVDDGAPAWELRDVYTSLHADLSDIGVDDHHDMVHDHSDDLGGGLLILNSFYDNDSGIRSIIVGDGDMSIDLRMGNSFIVDVSDASVSGMSDGFKVNGYGSTYFKVGPVITEVYPAPLAISSVVAQMDITVGGAFSIAGGTDSSMSVTGGALSLSTITTGELDLTSAGLLDINAGANLDIDVTGNIDIDSTVNITLTAGGVLALVTPTIADFTNATHDHADAAGGELIPPSNIILDKIGTPTFDDLKDWFDTVQSAGVVSGGNITDAGSGTVDISAVSGVVKTTDSDIGVNQWFGLAGVTGQVLTDSSSNYIAIDYNGGTPQWIVGVSNTSNGHTIFNVGKVYREGTNVDIIDSGLNLYDFVKRLQQHHVEEALLHFTSGAVLSETGTLNIAVSSGIMYAGINRIITDAIDTSGVDTFEYYYNDGSWTETSETDIDNLYYNNYGVGLAELSNNQYGVHWVYKGTNASTYVIYGTSSYTLVEAQSAQPPSSLPDHVSGFGVLRAKIIISKNGVVFTEIESLSDTQFSSTTPANHNELGLIQGGSAGDYYHLTGANTTAVIAHLAEVAEPHGTTEPVTSATHTFAATELNLGVNYAGDVTITIPTTEIAKDGREFEIKDESLNALVNNITIETEGAELIEGEANAIIEHDGEAIRLRARGSNLYVV